MTAAIRYFSVLLTIVFTQFLGAHLAHARDFVTEIATHQEQYNRLENEFTASQARILSSTSTYEAQEAAYGLLEYVGQRLSIMSREFDVLATTLTMSSFVTDRRMAAHARKFVELQRNYMEKQASGSIQYIEKILLRSKDQETTRLLLAARDVFRSSTDFLSRIKGAEGAGK